MNKLGYAGAPGSGSFLTADPLSENEELVEAAHSAERKALTALREHQDRNGSSNGQTNGQTNGHH
jgi:ubiquinol-cytochrome c reductase cytochrome b subunit